MTADLWCRTIDWGDFPTWLASIGALLAVAFAAAQYWKYVNSALQEQASKVVGYAESFNFDYGNPRASTSNVVVLNNRDLPIYECSVRLLPWDWKTISGDRTLDGCFYSVIGPTSSTSGETFDRELVPPPLVADGRRTIAPPVEIEFTDAAGQRWVRRPDGRLKRLKPN